MRVQSGCSSLGSCCLITFTYKADGPRQLGAAYVAKDWREFWRRWNKIQPKLEWLRVSELTKKKVIHHHVVAGPWKGEIRCYGPKFEIGPFERVFDRCECLSHVASRLWYSVTGDSYIVHAMPIHGPAGAAVYLAKYMMKGFGERAAVPL